MRQPCRHQQPTPRLPECWNPFLILASCRLLTRRPLGLDSPVLWMLRTSCCQLQLLIQGLWVHMARSMHRPEQVEMLWCPAPRNRLPKLQRLLRASTRGQIRELRHSGLTVHNHLHGKMPCLPLAASLDEELPLHSLAHGCALDALPTWQLCKAAELLTFLTHSMVCCPCLQALVMYPSAAELSDQPW